MRARRGPRWAWRRARRQAAFERARYHYRCLIDSLGGRCECCGCEDPTLLSIDHVDGITWVRRELRYDARIARYIEEWCEGVRLRVLCLLCNSRDGRARQLAAVEAVPF